MASLGSWALARVWQQRERWKGETGGTLWLLGRGSPKHILEKRPQTAWEELPGLDTKEVPQEGRGCGLWTSEAGGEGAQPLHGQRAGRGQLWTGSPSLAKRCGGGGPCQPPPYKCYSAPHFPFWPPCRGLSVSLGLPLGFYSWNSHCGCLWVSVGGPRGLRRPSLLPTCHTSSSHSLPELPKTPHTMDLGTPRPRLTPMKGTQPKRVRGSPEVTQLE